MYVIRHYHQAQKVIALAGEMVESGNDDISFNRGKFGLFRVQTPSDKIDPSG